MEGRLVSAFDSVFGTETEVALSSIERSVAASRARMDADEARMIRQIEAFLAHPSHGDGQ